MPWVLIVIAVPALLLALPRLLPKTPLSARMPSSVAVYDAQHHLLRLTLASDEQYRLWVPLSKVSPDCSDHDFHIAMANVNPINSLIPLQWNSTITPQRFGSIPRTYIETSEDRTLTSKLQHQFQADVPGATVRTLATSHSPFFSQPEALANLIMQLARSTPRGFTVALRHRRARSISVK